MKTSLYMWLTKVLLMLTTCMVCHIFAHEMKNETTCAPAYRACPSGGYVMRDPLRNCTAFQDCGVVACTGDWKSCPDGSYVGRNPALDCSFYECPISLGNNDIIACTGDWMECPDGSFVGRNPQDRCEFYDCSK